MSIILTRNPETDVKSEGSRDFLETKSVLCDALDSLKLTQVFQITKYSTGNNFWRFCQKFIDFCSLTGLKHADLNIVLLQHVDDQTYSKLKTVKLTDVEKSDAEIFCRIYQQAIYGDEEMRLKTELLTCQQNEGENVDGFVHRLRDKATMAYRDQEVSDDNCLLALLNGVRSIDMRRKLNEAELKTFSEAVKLARRIERVEEMTKESQDKSDAAIRSSKDRTVDTVRAQHGSDKLYKRLDQGDGKSFKTNNFSKNQRNRLRGVQCYGCGNYGHKIAQCGWNTPNEGQGVQDFMHRENTGYSKQHLNCQLAVSQVGGAKRVIILIRKFGACSQAN